MCSCTHIANACREPGMFRGGKGKVSWCVVPEACSHAEQTSWSGLEGLFFYIFLARSTWLGSAVTQKAAQILYLKTVENCWRCSSCLWLLHRLLMTRWQLSVNVSSRMSGRVHLIDSTTLTLGNVCMLLLLRHVIWSGGWLYFLLVFFF